MGQATVDLPDPLQSSSADLADAGALSPEALASADDLLSQLAGDDIDRLLAEAETEPKPLPVRTPPPAAQPAVPAEAFSEPPPAEPPVTAQEEAALDAVFAEVQPTDVAAAAELAPATAPPGQTSAPVNSDVQMASELAELDRMLSSDASAMMPPAEAELPSAQTPAIDQAEQLVADSTLAAAERQALTAPTTLEDGAVLDTVDPAATAADSSVDLQLPDTVQDRPSLPVRVLEWINYPLLMCSDGVRETLGKVALLTLFNSVAVLIYVLLFRRHPHQ
jgi:hypothetical protein